MAWQQWNSGAPIIPNLTGIVNPAPMVNPTGVLPPQYTADQWAQMQQQNWQQWAQWQQQYQQWHQQYGAEYQKSMSALSQAVQPPILNTSIPPPLPPEVSQPQPPPNEPVKEDRNFGISSQSNFPTPPPNFQPPSQNKNNTNQFQNAPAQQSFNFNRNSNQNNRNFPGGGYQQNRNQPNNPIKTQSKPPSLMSLPLKKPEFSKEGDAKRIKLDSNVEGGNKGDNKIENEQASGNVSQNPDDLSETEKKFIKQFTEWEAQFNKWKEQNVNHPDKEQYKEYEKKWEAWRTQLLERREQMRRKRLGLLDNNQKQTDAATLGNNNNQTPNKTFDNEPFDNIKPPHNLDMNTEIKDDGSSFLQLNTSDGIPGLDLVGEARDEEKSEPPQKETIIELDKSPPNKAKTIPDLEAISKGINTILGDQKLLSMLSMVSQNQKIPNSSSFTDTTSRIESKGSEKEFNETTSSHGDQRNNFDNASSFDDQSRSSFGGKPEQDWGSKGNFDRDYDHFGKGKGGFRGRNQENYRDNDNFCGNQDDFQQNQDRFQSNQDRFQSNQDRFQSNQDRFQPNQDRFQPNQDNFRQNQDSFQPNQDNFRKNPDDFQQNSFRNDNFRDSSNYDRLQPPNNFRNQSNFQNAPSQRGSNSFEDDDNSRNTGFSGNFRPPNFNRDDDLRGSTQFNEQNNSCNNNFRGGNNFQNVDNFGGESNFNRGNFNDDYYQDEYGQDRNYNDNNFHEKNFNKKRQKKFQNQRQFENENYDSYEGNDNYNNYNENYEENYNENYDESYGDNYEENYKENYTEDIPGYNYNESEGINQENLSTKMSEDSTPMWEPVNVIEYNHKSNTPEDIRISIEPLRTFDYRHKPVNRIPLPQRPDWLKKTLRNCREFDFVIQRYDQPAYSRYPPGYDRYSDSWRREDRRIKRDENLLKSKYDEIKPFEKIDERSKFEPPQKDFQRRSNDDFERPSLEKPRFQPPERLRFEGPERIRFEESERIRFEDPEKIRFEEPGRIRFEEPEKIRFDEPGRIRFDESEKIRFEDPGRIRFEAAEKIRFEEPERLRFEEPEKIRFEEPERIRFEEPEKIRFEEPERLRYESPERLRMENSRGRRFGDSTEQKDVDYNKDVKDIRISPPQTLSTKNITLIEDILSPPGRYSRAARIVIILRGPPGSGKTFLAKLIKDKEVENGGSAPRILSLDDYFMIEQEKVVEEDGKKTKVKVMEYEYDSSMEMVYRNSLFKAFKKTITDGYFPFIIVDNINDKVKYFGEMWSFAKQNGFQVYVCQLEFDLASCTKRNVHNRSESEIQKIINAWEPTPPHHPVLDATSLVQAASIPEVEMEEINSPPTDDFDDEEEESAEEKACGSKWDNFDCSIGNLAKLDGTSKPLRASKTMEDYLQIDDEWTSRESKPGQKRVRWADLEERKEQQKMRAIGFVVGQTNWDRMMDPTMGSGALTQTKYIERVPRFYRN